MEFRNLFFSLALLFGLMFCSCHPVDRSLLEGFWLAEKVTEEGNELDLDLSDLGFEFKGQNHYIYYNTEFLSEEGVYEVNGMTLVTTDTSGNNPMRKAVEIILLTRDSLHLRMNAGGKEQVLYLYRMNESEDEYDLDSDEYIEEPIEQDTLLEGEESIIQEEEESE